MMTDSMKVKVKIGTRVKLLGSERRGTIIGVVTLAKDPLVNVKLDSEGEHETQEMIAAYSLFEPIGPHTLQKGAA